MRCGQMDRRRRRFTTLKPHCGWRQAGLHELLELVVEAGAGKDVGVVCVRPGEDGNSGAVSGAGEIEHVRAGLDDTMREAFRDIRAAREKYRAPDLRTAAFMAATEKLVTAYQQLGTWP